jgi:trans-aconitate 2-methyltransferase
VPLWDLVELVENDTDNDTGGDAGIGWMVDLGCGDGEHTSVAAERLGASRLLALDSSPAMIARARRHTTVDRVFEAGDISCWTSGGDVDLVFANASLQWVPDHRAVLQRWTAALAPGGQLAVQVPANGDHPSHLVANEVATRHPFLDAFDGDPPPDPAGANVLLPEEYAELLHDLGYVRQHVRLQVYAHELPSSADVVEWVRGTNLTRFFTRLPRELHEPFVDAYRAALLDRIGRHEPYLYAFKRILMWARLD